MATVGRPRINWEEILKDFPGETHRDKLTCACRGRTVLGAAAFLGVSPPSLSAYVKRCGAVVERNAEGPADRVEGPEQRIQRVLADMPGDGLIEKFEWAWVEAQGSYSRLMALGLKETDIRSFRVLINLADRFDYRGWLNKKLEGLDRKWLRTPAGQQYLIKRVRAGELTPPTREEARKFEKRRYAWQRAFTRTPRDDESQA